MGRVLVLGADGMVGQMVARVLAASDGTRVEGTGRRDPAHPLFLDAEAGAEPLRDLLRRQGPFDYLVNCIGILSSRIDPEDLATIRAASLVNSVFPQLLAEVAAETGARVVHVSTDAVFSPDSGVCFEDTPADSSDPYGQTKALGEVVAPTVLNIRCSLIGPDSAGRKGLFEWFRGQPRNAEVPGYTDHVWNGVTTLQFARLCERLVQGDRFDAVRGEGATHHFCPNQRVSKYELLSIFRETFRPDVTITPVESPVRPVSRLLGTRRYGLRRIFGEGIPMRTAVSELAAVV